MSIHRPDYGLAATALEPRASRVRAIWENQFYERVRALNVVLLAFLFVVTLVPLLLSFYLAAVVPQFAGTSNPLEVFYTPFGFGVGFFFLVLLVASVGSGIIATDLAARSMTMYRSRPITPLDYLAGKTGAVATWILLGTAVPGLIGAVIALALGYVGLVVAVEAGLGFLALGILTTLALGGLAVLFSSLSSRTALAGAGIFGSLIGAEAVVAVVRAVTQDAAALYASPLEDILGVARYVFQLPSNPIDPGVAALLLAALGIGSLVLVHQRLERTEVVSE